MPCLFLQDEAKAVQQGLMRAAMRDASEKVPHEAGFTGRDGSERLEQLYEEIGAKTSEHRELFMTKTKTPKDP